MNITASSPKTNSLQSYFCLSPGGTCNLVAWRIINDGLKAFGRYTAYRPMIMAWSCWLFMEIWEFWMGWLNAKSQCGRIRYNLCLQFTITPRQCVEALVRRPLYPDLSSPVRSCTLCLALDISASTFFYLIASFRHSWCFWQQSWGYALHTMRYRVYSLKNHALISWVICLASRDVYNLYMPEKTDVVLAG